MQKPSLLINSDDSWFQIPTTPLQILFVPTADVPPLWIIASHSILNRSPEHVARAYLRHTSRKLERFHYIAPESALIQEVKV